MSHEPPDDIVAWFCPACGLRLDGLGITIDETIKRRECTRLIHKAVPKGYRFVRTVHAPIDYFFGKQRGEAR